jgi:hypothetical protein
MSERHGDANLETVRLPAGLRAEVDDLYREQRGYEPASFQESLSLVVDLAAGRLDPASAETPDHPDRSDHPDRTDEEAPSVPLPETSAGPEAPDGASDHLEAIDEVFPRDWDADEAVRTYLPRVVAAYLTETAAHDDAEHRVEAAIGSVAADADVSPTALQQTLVTRLYAGAGISTALSREFFQEALAAVEEVDERPPVGVQDAASDGGVASEDADFSVDSLLTDAAAEPTADCERCGTTAAVDDLQTVIGPENGSTVRLLCPRCADGE